MANHTMYQGTLEYLGVDVTSETGAVLSTQPVAISLDAGATWNDAAWEGDPGETRTCVLLLGPSTTPKLPDPGSYDIRVKIIDDPEHPIINVGYLIVRE